MKTKVLITGINGQDGNVFIRKFYDEYEIHGIIRRTSNINQDFLNFCESKKINLYYGDIVDYNCVSRIINDVRPNIIFNFSALSHVKVSFELPITTFQTNTIGFLNVLESVRQNEDLRMNCKIYQASTSEMFGNTKGPLNEKSKMEPVSPYGVSKLASHHLCKVYRGYNMFVVSGILFNHESKYRGSTFLTKKVVNFFKSYKKGQVLNVGNFNARRDWNSASYFMEMISVMMDRDKPEDLVLSSGLSYSVEEFIEKSVEIILKKKIEWKGEGFYKKGFIDEELVVEIHPRLIRLSDIHNLVGDSRKAIKKIGFIPCRFSLDDIIHEMIEE